MSYFRNFYYFKRKFLFVIAIFYKIIIKVFKREFQFKTSQKFTVA